MSTVLTPNFDIIKQFDEYLNTGDPMGREWFLVKSKFWPVFLCAAYVLFVKVIGPFYMKNRKPFNLRRIMVVYNFSMVSIYFTCSVITIYAITQTDVILCGEYFDMENFPTYIVAGFFWIMYLLKYVEFLDTIFSVLTKRYHAITHLHVIHHSTVPLICWMIARTDRTFMAAVPLLINSCIHVIMYTYYGLAAMGPSVRKYLWWKKYLTIAQMCQFIAIIFYVTAMRSTAGCQSSKISFYLCLLFSGIFLALFYNHFWQTYMSIPNPMPKSSSDGKEVNVAFLDSRRAGEAVKHRGRGVRSE